MACTTVPSRVCCNWRHGRVSCFQCVVAVRGVEAPAPHHAPSHHAPSGTVACGWLHCQPCMHATTVYAWVEKRPACSLQALAAGGQTRATMQLCATRTRCYRGLEPHRYKASQVGGLLASAAPGVTHSGWVLAGPRLKPPARRARAGAAWW